MWVIFNGSLTPLTFLLFILSCIILLISSTVISGFATFVPRAADMPKAANSSAFFDFLTKPKLSQLTYHIQEYTIPGKNDSIPLYPLYASRKVPHRFK